LARSRNDSLRAVCERRETASVWFFGCLRSYLQMSYPLSSADATVLRHKLARLGLVPCVHRDHTLVQSLDAFLPSPHNCQKHSYAG
jgi:hypothetical protein